MIARHESETINLEMEKYILVIFWMEKYKEEEFINDLMKVSMKEIILKSLKKG